MYRPAHQSPDIARSAPPPQLARARYSPDGPSSEQQRVATLQSARAPQPQSGLPLAFVRSALFSVSDTGTHLKQERLPVGPLGASQPHADEPRLVYTGPRLGQQHALVWQALMTLSIRRKCADPSFGEELVISRRDILEVLGWKSTSSAARSWVWSLLLDLQGAIIELRTPRHTFSQSLISSMEVDEITGRMKIQIPERTLALLTDEVACIDLTRKRSLGRDPLTLWLHDFISSQHNDPGRMIPWSIDALRTLSGSTKPLAKFRASLKKAAAALTTCESPLLTKWRIDDQDRLVYTKTKTRVVFLPAPALQVQEARSKHAAGLQAAIDQRARIIL